MKNDLFFFEIDKLHQLKCWSVSVGSGSGSHVSFNFGKKLLRNKPLSNPNLSELSKKYTGEYTIFIEECSWRLELNESVICGSSSPNDNNGIMVSGLKKLIDKKVSSIKITKPALDMEVIFDNNFKLVLFCNTIDIEDGDNYTFFTPQKSYTVQGYGDLVIDNK